MELLLDIVKEKIVNDNTYFFTLEEISRICSAKKVDVYDLINTLEISRNVYSALCRKDAQKAYSRKYKACKEEYLESISNDIILFILKNKLKTDFSHKFSYEEIDYYSKLFNINTEDFLTYILGIKSKKHQSYFHSIKYKTKKDEYLKIYGEAVLSDLVNDRVKTTGNYMFTFDEIKELGEVYGLNPRDFMVYVLGRSEQLYYDFVSGRQDRCYSDRYKSLKEERLKSKKEEFYSGINLNVATKLSVDELKEIANNLDISLYDLITNVIGRSRQDYYYLANQIELRPGVVRKNVVIGKNLSTALPKEFCEKNLERLQKIIDIAVRSAISYMLGYGCYSIIHYYKDLLSEGYLCLAERGNKIDKDGNPLITTDEFDESYGAIFYKKVYYNTIDVYRKIINSGFKGEVYDITTKTKGKEEDYAENAYFNSLVEALALNELERNLLYFFSNNSYSEETINLACQEFKVSKDYILNMFDRIREYVKSNVSRKRTDIKQ